MQMQLQGHNYVINIPYGGLILINNALQLCKAYVIYTYKLYIRLQKEEYITSDKHVLGSKLQCLLKVKYYLALDKYILLGYET